jgi:ribosomal protein S18 acetylase RimI-like enzyme
VSRVKVRRARIDDLDAVTPLFTAYRDFYRQPREPEAERAFLQARLDNDESVIFIAEVDGGPAGFVQLYPCFSSVTLKRVWVLNDLYTSKKARKQGVGTALLEQARAFAAETGAKGLVLETTPDNETAQALYEQLGWKRDRHYHYFIDA